MSIENLLSSVAQDTLLVIGGYVALGGLYLVVVPLILFFWMHRRWHVMGKFERFAVFGLVFFFFPGMIVFSPFLNLRLSGQGEV